MNPALCTQFCAQHRSNGKSRQPQRAADKHSGDFRTLGMDGAENTRKQYPTMKKEPLKTGDFKLYSRMKHNSRAMIASVSD